MKQTMKWKTLLLAAVFLLVLPIQFRAFSPFFAICRAAERFVKETGATKIHTLKLRGHVRDDMRGAADHPGIFAHKDMAEQLVSFIRTIPLP